MVVTTNNLLENINSDVCGPMETVAIDGEKYFVTFIDKASGRLAVSLLHTVTAQRKRHELC